MKKILTILITISLLALSACSGALHNLSIDSETSVTLEVINFPVSDGDYDWRGSFDADPWSNACVRLIAVSSGSGLFIDTTKTAITNSEFSFSITASDSSWDKAWYPATEGNQDDMGNGLKNFLVSIELDGAVHAIKIDGSTNPATITLDDTVVE